MPEEVIVYTDGGSRGNPGPAAAGFIIEDKSEKLLQASGFFLGKATNNVAEYTAVVKALQKAREIGARTVTLYSDSELLVRQINGSYKVKSPLIKPLYADAMRELEELERWKVVHVFRHKNSEADRLVNAALDRRADIDESPAPTKKTPKTRPIRIVAMISGGGTTLLNILDRIKDGSLNASIPLVISSRSEVKGVGRARNAGLKVRVVRKKDFSDIDAFSGRIAECIDEAKADLVIQGGWLCLWKIPPRYENRVMNIHPALLPSFGGKGMWGHHVHEAVLAAGCKISGCTVHFCTNEYDAGPIIVQRACPAYHDDTPDTLAARVFEQECIAYPEAIKLFAQGKLSVEGSVVKIVR